MQHKVTRFAAIALVALAVLLALAAFLVGDRGKTPDPATPVAARPAAAEIPVVVAARTLAAGAKLQASDLKTELRPYAPAGSYDDASALLDQVPLRDIAAGATLFGSDLARGLSLQLQAGERAIAVPVDELAGAGNRIQPGEVVDVFLSLQNGRGEEERAQARLLLPRLRVLGYGDEDVARPTGVPVARETGASASADEDDAANDDTAQVASADRAGPTARRSNATRRNTSDRNAETGARNNQARSAVLAVPVEDANHLLLGAQRGKLFLALRHPGDPATPDPGLFPEPRPVLAARANLAQQQRDALAQPENSAYAGLDLEGLAGDAPRRRTASPQSRTGHAPRPLEIIRGTQR